MPNTAPALDTPELIEWVIARGERSACRVFPVAAATVGRRGERATEIVLLRRAGAVAFSDDGDAVASAGVMLDVMRQIADADDDPRSRGPVFMQHAQEPTLTVGSSMHAGEVSTRLGLTGWPRVAEELIVERDIRLRALADCRYHVQHVSCEGSVDLIREARALGLAVTAEASPHHLHLTHEACAGFDTSAKMNPPLRERSDVDALRAGVAQGVITVLATDHAPHAPQDKETDFAGAAFGIIGLQSALPLYAEALVASGMIGWPRLIELLTVEPARLCGLDRVGLGTLAVGGPADVTVIDPDLRWTLTAEELAQMGGLGANTPFLDRELTGRPVLTLCRGVPTALAGRALRRPEPQRRPSPTPAV